MDYNDFHATDPYIYVCRSPVFKKLLKSVYVLYWNGHLVVPPLRSTLAVLQPRDSRRSGCIVTFAGFTRP